MRETRDRSSHISLPGEERRFGPNSGSDNDAELPPASHRGETPRLPTPAAKGVRLHASARMDARQGSRLRGAYACAGLHVFPFGGTARIDSM